MCARLGYIEQLTNGSQEQAQALNLLLLWILHVSKELLDTLMHDVFRKHLKFEQLANEFDQTETLTFGLLGSIILLRVQLALVFALLLAGCLDHLVVVTFGHRSTCYGFFGNPYALKAFLTLKHEIHVERLATSDWFTIRVLDANLGLIVSIISRQS